MPNIHRYSRSIEQPPQNFAFEGLGEDRNIGRPIEEAQQAYDTVRQIDRQLNDGDARPIITSGPRAA